MTDFIAMIPARMGSKRVPKKNIRFFCGKPLIQYAIDGTKASGCFDEIWVNSESEHIGRLALACGINFHKRPAALASDTATNQDFTIEFLRAHKCEYVVMVNPTSPLLKPETIQRFCEFIRAEKLDTALSVLEERAECFFKEKPVNFSIEEKINSQNLEPIEKIVWALTAWRRDHFLSVAQSGLCSVFSGRLGRFPISLDESCDIDTQEDWDLAEAVYISRNRVKNTILPEYWGG
nr:acylneuraminate cytidylyltransferase family protein [uncultured Desulfobacter sp.]